MLFIKRRKKKKMNYIIWQEFTWLKDIRLQRGCSEAWRNQFHPPVAGDASLDDFARAMWLRVTIVAIFSEGKTRPQWYLTQRRPNLICIGDGMLVCYRSRTILGEPANMQTELLINLVKILCA